MKESMMVKKLTAPGFKKSYFGKIKDIEEWKNSDNYFTSKKMVEYIFDKIPKGYLKDKIIYSFADSDESEFVKYIKSHKELGYKEYIYTSDEFQNHEDIFKKADIIITNPPFTCFRDYFNWIKKYNKDFILLNTMQNLFTIGEFDYNIYRIGNIDKFTTIDYITKEKKEVSIPTICLVSNIQLNLDKKKLNIDKNLKDIINPVYITFTHDRFGEFKNKTFLNVDRIKDIPFDVDYVFVPITIMLYDYKEYFDIIKYTKDNYCNIRFKSKEGYCSDDKNRYLRILLKRK